MATSGSFNYPATGTTIILEAMEMMGVIGIGETTDTDFSTTALTTLNMMVKAWQGRGINIFTLQRMAVFMEADKIEYTFSADKVGYAYGFTDVVTAMASGAGTVEVTSITGINNGDAIGVELDDGTMDWDTVNGAPSGTTVTLTGTLGAAAAVGNVVYFYTAITPYPLRIHNVNYRAKTGVETPGTVLRQMEYIELPNKTTEGVPLHGWYDRRIADGVWKVWPEPSSVFDAHILYVQRQVEDFDAASDSVDFPQEWYWALATNLARNLLAKFGVPDEIGREIKQMAREALFDAESFDVEDGLQIQPDFKFRR